MMIAYAERNRARGQQVEDVFVIPTDMAEFERVPPAPVQHVDEGGQPFAVLLEIGRQLKQHRSGLRPQQPQPACHQLQAVLRLGRQPFPMGDEARCLPGEDEVARGSFGPVTYRVDRRRSIKTPFSSVVTNRPA